jgi:hypothetical protein
VAGNGLSLRQAHGLFSKPKQTFIVPLETSKSSSGVQQETTLSHSKVRQRSGYFQN